VPICDLRGPLHSAKGLLPTALPAVLHAPYYVTLVRNQDEKLCNLCTNVPNFTFSLSSGKGKKLNPVNPVNPACPVEPGSLPGCSTGVKKEKSLAEKTVEDADRKKSRNISIFIEFA
jgi:hypothetical protein